jgi:NADP-dependent 3-hydroxy acid dehydrogenase YdfG
MGDALIWGASGGIGSALVRHLKQDGWRIFGAARDTARIPDEADEKYAFEAGKATTIAEAARLLAMESDAIDLMVYAAGGIRSNVLEKLSADDWDNVIAANLTGVQYTVQASLPLMSKTGHIVVIGAYVDHITLPRMGAYTAAKAALEPLLKIMQKENRKLKFTLVRSPAVDTPFWENAPFNLPKTALQPQAVAEAIVQRYHSGEDGLLDL